MATAPVYPLYTSNVVVQGSISASNMGTMRNKILNGDMRVDKANAGAGHAAASTASASNVVRSLDKFEVACTQASGALCADQVVLSPADRQAVGGALTNAVQISAFPTVGLNAYFPFDGALTDAGSNAVALSSVGTMNYRSGVVGSNALYLANEANVSGNTLASNYITASNYVFPSSFSISMWVNPTASNSNYTSIFFITNAGSTATGNIYLAMQPSTRFFDSGFYGGSFNATTTAMSLNTWYHVAVTFTSNVLTSYFNGVLVGSCSTAFVQNGFKLGMSGSASPQFQPFAGLIDDFRIYNRVLVDSEIRGLAGFTGVYPAPSSGLAARLEFDGALTDSVGMLSAPTLTGTAVYTANCRSGSSALDVTANTAGSTSTVMVTYPISSNPITSTLCFSAWINPTANTSGFQIPVSFDNSSNYLFNLGLNGSSNVFAEGIFGNTYYSTSQVALSSGQWSHITIVASSGDSIRLYVNGMLATQSTSITASTQIARTGGVLINRMLCGNSINPYAYKGLIDDVRIYNRALSPQEVAGLYYSYAPLGASLYRQPIDGTQLAELAWGTSAAQPAVLSCWVKNQSSVAQQYAVALNNNSGLVAYMPFDGSAADQMGGVTGPVVTGTLAYSASSKVGSQCLDLTANTAGQPSVNASSAVTYGYPLTPNIPLSMSGWFNFSDVTTVQVPVSIGNTNLANTIAFQFGVSSGNLFVSIGISYASYGLTTTVSVQTNTWYHIGVTVTATPNSAGVLNIYVNGALSISTQIPSGFLTQNNNASLPNILRIGAQTGSIAGYAFKGLIDDVRIYNRALSASEIAAIYAANASSTVATGVSMPRSLVFPTPSIPANSWQRVVVPLPAETQGFWPSDSSVAGWVSLCAGAGASNATSNVAAASNNAASVWNSLPEYTATGIQVYGGSASNLLALPTASVLWTGLQLEKGDQQTPFEVRPVGVESLAATTSLDSRGRTNMILDGSISAANMGMFRNVLINGGFDVNQRGTSTDVANPTAASGNPGGWIADRWNIFRGGYASGASMAIGTLGATELPVIDAGVTRFARVSRGAADTSTQNVVIQQCLETVNSLPFRGQPVTLSFYYRTGPGFSSTFFVGCIYYGTGTDEAARGGFTGAVEIQLPLSPNANWTKATLTTTLPLSTRQIAAHVYATPVSTAASNWYYDIAAMQLERGTVATPFELRPYGVELQLCQRYYQIAYPSGGAAINSGSFSGTIIFNTVMRGVPTASQLVALGVTDGVNNNWSQSSPSVSLSGATIYGTQATYGNFGTSLTQYRPLFCWFGSSGPTHFSAEI